MSAESGRVLDGILGTIGNTPLARLPRLSDESGANILAKLEYLNPSGSVKDRMALAIVEAAEREGVLQPGVSTFTCSSSGNTAQALAMVCATKGYRVIVRLPEATDVPEKIRALHRYGAEVEVVPMDDENANVFAKEHGLHGTTIEIPGRLRCLQEEQAKPDHIWIRQFANPANVAATRMIGTEILEQTEGRVDVFIASIGTGGTFLGVSEVLKSEVDGVRCIAVQPTGWEGFDDPLAPERQYISGISGGIVEQIRDSGIADEIAYVGNDDARRMADRLSREEGIYCGTSSGAHLFIAEREARKPGADGSNIVTLIVDRGDRYVNDDRFIT